MMNDSTAESESFNFSSPQEEVSYLRKKLKETQTEFQEFQESSRELELEYETQVKQLEKINNDYMNQLTKLDLENDQLKSRYSLYVNDTQHRLNEYQQQLTELQSINTRLTSYIRELEQNNDDLERARRALAASLEDFEGQLNQQIERNVLLENEVSEKEELECVVQRLKEESRDLKHELIAKQTETAKRKQQMMDSLMSSSKSQPDTSLISDTSRNLDNSCLDFGRSDGNDAQAHKLVPDAVSPLPESPSHKANGKPAMVDSTTSPPTTPSHTTTSQQGPTPPSPTMPAMLMSPSTRISALNIVSDLLRKVLSLESKLASVKKATG